MMTSAELLRALGGWDEGFRIDFGDVDLCLRAIDAGRRVMVEPRAKLLHRVHATQGIAPHDEDDTRAVHEPLGGSLRGRRSLVSPGVRVRARLGAEMSARRRDRPCLPRSS